MDLTPFSPQFIRPTERETVFRQGLYALVPRIDFYPVEAGQTRADPVKAGQKPGLDRLLTGYGAGCFAFEIYPRKPVKTRDKACFVTGLWGFVPPLSRLRAAYVAPIDNRLYRGLVIRRSSYV